MLKEFKLIPKYSGGSNVYRKVEKKVGKKVNQGVQEKAQKEYIKRTQEKARETFQKARGNKTAKGEPFQIPKEKLQANQADALEKAAKQQANPKRLTGSNPTMREVDKGMSTARKSQRETERAARQAEQEARKAEQTAERTAEQKAKPKKRTPRKRTPKQQISTTQKIFKATTNFAKAHPMITGAVAMGAGLYGYNKLKGNKKRINPKDYIADEYGRLYDPNDLENPVGQIGEDGRYYDLDGKPMVTEYYSPNGDILDVNGNVIGNLEQVSLDPYMNAFSQLSEEDRQHLSERGYDAEKYARAQSKMDDYNKNVSKYDDLEFNDAWNSARQSRERYFDWRGNIYTTLKEGESESDWLNNTIDNKSTFMDYLPVYELWNAVDSNAYKYDSNWFK